MKTLIVSDVHLQVGTKGADRRDAFVAFLRGIDPSEYRRLIVLGDLFDFWFEYRHVIFSGYFEVLRAFAELRDAGVDLHLVCGNHDFWAGRFLEDELAFSVHQDELRLDEQGMRVRFFHGDGLNPDDWQYRLYKRFARAAPVVWAFRQLHPDLAMGVANFIANGSRALKHNKDLSKGPEVAALRDFAVRTVESDNADVVVCGHSHYPVKEEIQSNGRSGLYLNSGDWLFHKTVIEWDGADFELKQLD